MAVGTFGAFAAGIVVGWLGRSAAGSSRDAMVQAIVQGHRVRDGVKRVVAEQVEWFEDMFAEGRARFDARRESSDLDDHVARPQVVELKKKRGHAA